MHYSVIITLEFAVAKDGPNLNHLKGALCGFWVEILISGAFIDLHVSTSEIITLCSFS